MSIIESDACVQVCVSRVPETLSRTLTILSDFADPKESECKESFVAGFGVELFDSKVWFFVHTSKHVTVSYSYSLLMST